MGFSGCAPMIVEYDSSLGNRNAIRSRANITVSIKDQNFSVHFKKPETKRSIINAITQDLNKNIFVFGEEEIDVFVNVERLSYRENPLLVILTAPVFPLWFLGMPVGEGVGGADVSLEIQTIEGGFIGSYRSEQTISKWYSIYNTQVFPNVRSKGGLTKDALRMALEDIKKQILRDRAVIARALQEKQPELVTETGVEVGKHPNTPSDHVPVYSDVDRNIPMSFSKNPDALGVILGIEKYRNITDVSYAKCDAITFKEYMIRVLGIRDDVYHLYFRTDEDATKAEFEKLFSGNGWLARRSRPTTDIYIYYAGHGAPEVRERSAYLHAS